LTITLTAALILTLAGFLVIVDRKDKRHDKQLTRLLVHVQAPERAVAHAITAPADGPLYLPPDDDEAWNTAHGKAD
jgi:hypothetical protein